MLTFLTLISDMNLSTFQAIGICLIDNLLVLGAFFAYRNMKNDEEVEREAEEVRF